MSYRIRRFPANSVSYAGMQLACTMHSSLRSTIGLPIAGDGSTSDCCGLPSICPCREAVFRAARAGGKTVSEQEIARPDWSEIMSPLIRPNHDNNRPTVSQLLTGAAGEVRELAVAHGEQFRAEVRSTLSRAHTAFLLMVSGLLLGALGFVFLMIALVSILADWFHWPSWAAWAIVGLMALVVGIVIWRVGRRFWSSVRFLPEHSLKSVWETLQWMTSEKERSTSESKPRESN